MHNSRILTIKIILILFSFLNANYNHGYNSSVKQFDYYDSIYTKATDLIKNDKLEKSIMLLKEIISKQRTYQKNDDILIMNANYDLGQIYLSRLGDYNKAVIQFEQIYNNVYSGYEKEVQGSKKKNLIELKEKSLFMLGYVFHNHLGNFTLAQNYYNTFLSKFPNSDLSSSVEYELNMINTAVKNFNK